MKDLADQSRRLRGSFEQLGEGDAHSVKPQMAGIEARRDLHARPSDILHNLGQCWTMLDNVGTILSVNVCHILSTVTMFSEKDHRRQEVAVF